MNSFPDSNTYNNVNEVWCAVIAKTMAQSGMRSAIVSGGGRSSAMVMALNEQAEIATHVFADERSGAFFALGLAKRSNQPVGICTTSGSAVANLIPALVEAKECGIPLILLTCDRPRSVRKGGALQCADHMGICNAVVVDALDLESPQDSIEVLRSLRTQLEKTFEASERPELRGPVHFNIPLHGRLTSMDRELGYTPPILPEDLFAVSPVDPKKSVNTHTTNIDMVIEKFSLGPNQKGLIFVGPHSTLDVDAITRFANETGYPIIADAPSGLRRPKQIPNLISNGDLMVLVPSVKEFRPDLIIRIGELPVASMTQSYLESRHCNTIRMGCRENEDDCLSPDSVYLGKPDQSELSRLSNELKCGDSKWTQAWLEESAQVQSRKESYFSELGWGECKAAWMVCNAPEFDLLHVANSMAIRHANLYCEPKNKNQYIEVNRGVSGIDGTISTFLGELNAVHGKGLLLLGDLATVHDIGALQIAGKEGRGGTMCILNNGGGAIFDMLSCSVMPDYERIMRNPPSVDFGKIAVAYNLHYIRCSSVAELSSALDESWQSEEFSIIELLVPSDSLKTELPPLFMSLAGMI